MKKSITNKELLEKIWEFFTDIHKIENDLTNIKVKLHNLWWDIKEAEKKIEITDGSIKNKK